MLNGIVVVFFADPSEKGSIQFLNKYGLNTVGANNDVMLGISEVSNLLKVQKDDRPRLFVHQRCVNLIKEFMLYRYEDSKEDRSVKENPKKVDDHAQDSLRYLCMSFLGRKGESDRAGDYIAFD